MLMSGEIDTGLLAASAVPKIWIVSSLIGIITPYILNALKLYRSAAIFAAIGSCLTIVLHIEVMYFNKQHSVDSVRPMFMYLPQLIFTLALIIQAVSYNKSAKAKSLSETNKKNPSIFEQPKKNVD